jgi:hypothetical protein
MEAATATPANEELQFAEAPWHFYAVCSFAFIWGGFCVFRFMSLQLGMLDSVGVNDLQLVAYVKMPGLFDASWAVCTWGAIAGAALLFIRSKLAVQAFTLSLVGLMATSYYQFAMSENAVSIYKTPVNFAVWVIALLTLLYATRAQSQDLLH